MEREATEAAAAVTGETMETVEAVTVPGRDATGVTPMLVTLKFITIFIVNQLFILAGLRVVPEWSYERQWEIHFSAQAQCFMTLVHL